MKILILHASSDLALTRRTSFNHAFCMLKYAPEHEYELQSFHDPVPARLRRERFDAIIMETTFLCWRWAYPRERYLGQALERFAFVADSSAFKVALPQDEYDHSEVLDDWLSAWNVNLIYSVCHAHRELFYPKCSRQSQIVEGLTGYIDDADLAMMKKYSRPFAQRAIDVGYRARDLQPFFGRFGRLKARLGERFLRDANGSGLKLDISLSPDKVLVGDDWLRFLGNSRFTLGCESGSSVLDPRGEIRAACDAYLREHPDADFEEVEAACFPGRDMVNVFSAVSPRLFEVAMANSCQVLVPAPYLGLLKPDEHYIPLAEDFSNVGYVLDEMRSPSRAVERIQACREVLLDNDKLTYRGFVADLLRRIKESSSGCRGNQPGLVKLHRAEILHQMAKMTVRMAVNGAADLKEAEAEFMAKLATSHPDLGEEQRQKVAGMSNTVGRMRCRAGAAARRVLPESVLRVIRTIVQALKNGRQGRR